MFDYDNHSGNLILKKPTRRHAVGAMPRRVCKRGYCRVYVNGSHHLEHRLVWLYVKGVMPKHEIDHVDGNPQNNRISNLREANRSQNARNRGMQSNNTSGAKGVYWHKKNQKYVARLKLNGRAIMIGSFTTLEQAKSAFQDSARKAYGQFYKQ